MKTAKSVNSVTIRLPDERWIHITEEHAEMAGYLYDVLETIQEPSAVFEGSAGELLAAREIETGIYYRRLSRSKSGRRFYHHGIFDEALETNGKEKENMATVNLDHVLSLVPQALQLSQKNIWLSYDEEADVLYLNFKKPSHADDSELPDNDVIVRYEGEEVIGMTIMNASKKAKK